MKNALIKLLGGFTEEEFDSKREEDTYLLYRLLDAVDLHTRELICRDAELKLKERRT